MTFDDCMEQQIINAMKQLKIVEGFSCKYLLPCGICDKTDEICSHFDNVNIILKEADNGKQ